jgi:uncharacterized membrane protein YeaQ/YmgE (transglycosylase-associated protein family)
MEYFWVIVIGVVCGLLSGKFMAGKSYGETGDIIVGAMGAVIGSVLLERTGVFGEVGLPVMLAAACSGALLCLYGLRMTRKA